MELKICHLYPDVLNLYGDSGNILCMRRRLQWRGIGVSVTPVPIGESPSLADFDLFFMGGGQDFEQEVLLADLHRGKDKSIISAIEDGKTFLAICGGYQMLGHYYENQSGHRCDFLSAVDLYTVSGPKRMIGNFAFRCRENSGGSLVVGFENHSGRSYLGPGVEPLGRVIKGYGNNGEDGGEGLRYKNTFGTYSHGPLLPKNPLLCDHILQTALERKYGRAPDMSAAAPEISQPGQDLTSGTGQDLTSGTEQPGALILPALDDRDELSAHAAALRLLGIK